MAEVYTEPEFTLIPVDLEVEEGEVTRLDCKVKGHPVPDIRWLCDGRQLFDDRFHRILVNEDGIHSLVFESPAPSDSGMYTCLASSRGGETSFSAKFTVKRQLILH